MPKIIREKDRQYIQDLAHVLLFGLACRDPKFEGHIFLSRTAVHEIATKLFRIAGVIK